MSAIDEVFTRLRNEGRTAFMPFITAGDPDLEFTADCLRELDAVGSHLIELGIPYSDPIADGPIIQASYTRALDNGARLHEILEMVSRVGPEIKAPIVTMISFAIIFRMGLFEFLQRAKLAGIAGAIVPDLPVEESTQFAAMCADADFSLIHLITPTTPNDRAKMIARHSTGFIYYVSIAGITGERETLPSELVNNLKTLRNMTDLPICVGFGISQPAHAELLKPVADGLIVGSAIVRRMAQLSDDREERLRRTTLQAISRFAAEMIAAVQ